MSLADRLRKLGGKLGLIRVVQLPGQALDRKMTTRTVTLKTLATEIRAQEVQVLAQLPAEMSIEFAKVFTTAGITCPSHGWDMDYLQKILQAEPFKTMDRAAVQKALLERLGADKVAVEVLVKNAMARDKALDSFAAFVEKKMAERGDIRQQRLAELESQIQTLQEQGETLRRELKADKESWRQWQIRKMECEKQLAWAIGFLLDKPIVTVDPPESV